MLVLTLPIRNALRLGCLAAYLTGMIGSGILAEENTPASQPGISATWRLIENLAENRFSAELTLHNGTTEPLTAPWSLYFNSGMKYAPDQQAALLRLEQVNGDLYALRADAQFPPIAPAADYRISLTGSPWAINVSDAPSGLYLVRDDDSDTKRRPLAIPLEIAPFPDADKIRRGGGDQLPVVTPAARFAANERLSLVPIDRLSPVVPTPVNWKRSDGSFAIDGSTVIEFDPALENEALLLAAMLKRSSGLALQSQASFTDNDNAIRLRLRDERSSGGQAGAASESYSLRIGPNSGIDIVGSDAAGVFYGIQSLRALMPLESHRQSGRVEIGAIEIGDAPRFGYRGLMLDVGRNFQRVETVKKLLDLMAFYKLNRFHWHLSDDEGWRLEIKSLPELTSIGSRRGHTESESDRLIPSYGSGPDPDSASSLGSGYYTQTEFVDVLRYAKARHIGVIPEFDVPGHSRAAIRALAARAKVPGGEAKLELTDPADKSKYESVQGWRDNVLDIGRDATYQFLDVVVGEVAALYRQAGVPLEYVHLGGDEVASGAWSESPSCANIETPDAKFSRGQQLEVYFLMRASEIVARYGATAACWDDCMLAAMHKQWPQRPLVYAWNNVWGWGREDVAYQLANAGFDVVLSNATNLYFDLAIEKDPLEPGYYWAGFVSDRAPWEFNPFDFYQNAQQNSMGVPLAEDHFAKSARLTPSGRKHILGIQGHLWAENLRSVQRLEYMAFPRLIALAERAWAQEPAFVQLEDPAERAAAVAAAWNEFANVLGQRELPRLHELSGTVQFRVPPPGAIVQEGRLLTNVAYPGLKVRFTTDGSEPAPNSPALDGPMPLETEVRLRAFDLTGHGSRSVDIQAAQ